MRNLLISLVVFGGLVLAQGPMAWRRGPAQRGMMPQRGLMAQRMAGQGLAGAGALKEHLGLTDAQVEQIRALRKQEAANMQAQAAAIRAKALELRQLTESPSADPAKVGALTLELKQLREKAIASRSRVSEQTRAVLTSDQQAKLTQLEEAVKLGPAARQAVALGLVVPPQAGGPSGGRASAGERMRGGPARF